MMIGIGIWLHSKSSVKAWKKYMGYKVKSSTSTGSFISMFTLSFLAVFREGAETILFYAGIMPLISTSNLLIGIALAIVALIIIGIIMVKASGKLPISKSIPSSILVNIHSRIQNAWSKYTCFTNN